MTNTFSHGYALLIGVGASAYAPWSLPVTVRDVQALRGILTDPDLCGYPADHICLLHDAGATKQAILDGLAWLAERAAADGDATKENPDLLTEAECLLQSVQPMAARLSSPAAIAPWRLAWTCVRARS